MAAVKSTGLSTKGLRSEFFDKFDKRAEASFHEKLATRIDSDTDTENYRFLGSVPQVREWGTGRKAKGLGVESYSVENLKYESTLEIDRDEIADDQTAQIKIRVGELGVRAATHKDYLLSQLFMNGSSTGHNSYDGTEFFATDHEIGASGAQANEGTFDVGTVAGANLYDEPDSATLWGPQTFRASYDVAVAAMMRLKDDRGEYHHRSPTGLAVVCPWAKYATIRTALHAGLMPQIGSNVLTPAAIPEIMPFPEFTSSSVWYLVKLDEVIKPFIFQDREPISFDSQAEGSSEEFMREKYYYGIRARYRLTYGYWQFAYATTMGT